MSMKMIYPISIFLFFLTTVTCPMAKNIYLTPDLENLSGRYSGFTLEFKGIETPPSTFWSLCNWEMDIAYFKETHKDAKIEESHGGFQTTSTGKRMVFTLSDIYYTENGKSKILKAERIYPTEKENFLTSFNWKTNSYYKFIIRSWEDDETKKTFIGEWIQDMDTGMIYLIAYYNTNLEKSFITGTLSQFQQNFYEKHFGEERSFNIRNIYAYDIKYKKWVSLNTTTLSYDLPSWGYNTVGTHDFGFTKDYFYGSAGEPVEDQEKYDDINPEKLKGTINQTEIIKRNTNKFSLGFNITKSKAELSWKTYDGFTLHYRYVITLYKVIKGELNLILRKNITRPEQREYTLEGNFEEGGSYQFILGVYGLLEEYALQSLTRTVPKSS